jgi:protein-disulfide isomerase/uncharacterized membrane protein
MTNFRSGPVSARDQTEEERFTAEMNDAQTEGNAGPFFMGRLPFLLLLIPALIGAFATGFLTYRHIVLASHVGKVGQSFLCRASGRIDCDSILLTDYAVLFGYFPSAVLGLMGFAFVLWFTVNALINQRMRKVSWTLLVIYFFAAIGFSWYYAYLMMFEVDVICTWCIVCHVVNLFCLFSVVVISIKNREKFLLPEISTLAERIYFVTAGGAVALLVFFVAGMWEKSLSFEEARSKFDELANDPAVILTVLKAGPSHDVPISPGDPVFGLTTARSPIVMFTDFQCPVCVRVEALLRKLVTLNPKELKLVFKNLPLSKDCNSSILEATNFHPMSCPAARAAYAAFLLGGPRAFWQYSDLLFSNQKHLKDASLTEFAQKVGLDTSKFMELLKPDSPAAKKVQEDVELAVKFRLNSTPQLFFEGKRLPENFKGAYLVDAIEELIKANYPEKSDFKLRRDL